MENFFVIVVAGGKGERFGGKTTKLLTPLAGKPVIWHTLRAAATSQAKGIILVANREYLAEFEKIAEESAREKLIAVAPGGTTRTDSVRKGIRALEEHCEGDPIVLVHDGARPLAPPQLFDRCAEAVREWGAAIAAVPVVDTLKIVHNGTIVETPPREKFFAAQTPQGFKLSILKKALETEKVFTDDAAAVENMGFEVKIVPGERFNIKITTPQDLALAEHILKIIDEREKL